MDFVLKELWLYVLTGQYIGIEFLRGKRGISSEDCLFFLHHLEFSQSWSSLPSSVSQMQNSRLEKVEERINETEDIYIEIF